MPFHYYRNVYSFSFAFALSPSHQATLFDCYSSENVAAYSMKEIAFNIEWLANSVGVFNTNSLSQICISHKFTYTDAKFELFKSPLRYEVIKSDWHTILLCSPEFNSSSIVYYFHKKKKRVKTIYQDLYDWNSQEINPKFQIKFSLYGNNKCILCANYTNIASLSITEYSIEIQMDSSTGWSICCIKIKTNDYLVSNILDNDVEIIFWKCTRTHAHHQHLYTILVMYCSMCIMQNSTISGQLIY